MNSPVFWLLLILLFGLLVFRRSKVVRGWVGEQKTSINLEISLDSNTYKRFYNLIIPSKNGTAQIDHLIVSPYGLFIVETKNKTGWIFGSENQKIWTQSIYGSNYTFQNPIKQTYRQKIVLSEFLSIAKSKIHVVIRFAGDCKFKTPMPRNVIRRNPSSYINEYTERTLSDEDLKRVLLAIAQHVSSSHLTKRDHIKSLNERHNSTTICPNCGSKLIVRTARRGRNAGKQFLGCENYPKCRYAKDI